MPKISRKRGVFHVATRQSPSEAGCTRTTKSRRQVSSRLVAHSMSSLGCREDPTRLVPSLPLCYQADDMSRDAEPFTPLSSLHFSLRPRLFTPAAVRCAAQVAGRQSSPLGTLEFERGLNRWIRRIAMTVLASRCLVAGFASPW